MSTIDLYQLFRRIPDTTDDEAKAAAESILQTNPQAKEITTRTDSLKLGNELEKALSQFEARMTRLILGSAAVVIAAISAIVKLT